MNGVRAPHDTAAGARLVACAVCGGIETRRLYTKFGYSIGRCARCGLVYSNPRAPSEAVLARYSREYFWNEYLPALGVIDGAYELAQFDVRYAPLLELLRPAPGRRLLEIGCGAGFFLKAAERAGWRVRGVELSEEGARFARDRLELDVRREPAEAIAADIETFDAAVMLDTIEHLFDPGLVLKSIARVLVQNGVLLIGTPNFAALSRYVLGANWAVLSPLEHLYYFEEPTLRRLLEACGFTDVRFVRKHAAWTPHETTNFAYTHAPGRFRVRLMSLVGRIGGRRLARVVQGAGRQDILLCVARKSGRSS
jgi:SAM-dependent methyltransferase